MSVGSVSRNAAFKPIERAQSDSISSFSTFNEAETEVRPKSSTSQFRDVDIDIREREPLLENARRVNFAPNADLSSVSIPTNHGAENLNPARDGVFSRIHRILFPAAVAVGVAAGAAAVEIVNSTHINEKVVKKILNNRTADHNGLLTVFN